MKLRSRRIALRIVPALIGASFFTAAVGYMHYTTPAAIAIQPGKLIDLRPKYTVGKETRLKLSTDEISKTSIAGEAGLDSSSESKREMVIVLKCTAKTESGSTVEMRIESLKMSMSGGIAEGEFDSSKPPAKDGDNPIAAALRPMVGVPMIMDVDNDGNIRSITGNDKMQPAGPAAGMASQLTSFSGMQMLLSPITTVSKSKGEAKVGEKWTTTDMLDTQGFGRLKIETNYTLASVRGGMAEVPIQGSIALDSEGSALAIPVKLKDSKYTGKFKWNTEDGMIDSMDVDQSLALDVNVAGMSTSVTQTTRTKVSRVGR